MVFGLMWFKTKILIISFLFLDIFINLCKPKKHTISKMIDWGKRKKQMQKTTKSINNFFFGCFKTCFIKFTCFTMCSPNIIYRIVWRCIANDKSWSFSLKKKWTTKQIKCISFRRDREKIHRLVHTIVL